MVDFSTIVLMTPATQLSDFEERSTYKLFNSGIGFATIYTHLKEQEKSRFETLDMYSVFQVEHYC